MLACIAYAVALGARAGEPTPSINAADGGRFDGTWTVILDCAKAPDGALGYTFQFDAAVKKGYLRREWPEGPAELARAARTHRAER